MSYSATEVLVPRLLEGTGVTLIHVAKVAQILKKESVTQHNENPKAVTFKN